MKNLILKSILAGVLISLASIIYLNCSDKIIGSILFSIGLIAVIFLEANLFTGKVGYINSKKSFKDCILILIFNLVSAFLVGLTYKAIWGESIAMISRLDKTWYRILFDGVGCGALIYLAVELRKRTNSLIPVIICVAAFILAGFEHSIADAFYFGASAFSWKGILYLGLVILGNAVGSLIIRFLHN